MYQVYVWSKLSAEYDMDQPGVVASPARGHLKKCYYAGQTAPAAAAESRMLAYNRRIVQLYKTTHYFLLHFVLLTDAVAVHVLYCRFLKEKK